MEFLGTRKRLELQSKHRDLGTIPALLQTQNVPHDRPFQGKHATHFRNGARGGDNLLHVLPPLHHRFHPQDRAHPESPVLLLQKVNFVPPKVQNKQVGVELAFRAVRRVTFSFMMIAMVLISTKMNESYPERRSEELFEKFYLSIPLSYWQSFDSNQAHLFNKIIKSEALILDRLDYTLRIPAFYTFSKFLILMNIVDNWKIPFSEIISKSLERLKAINWSSSHPSQESFSNPKSSEISTMANVMVPKYPLNCEVGVNTSDSFSFYANLRSKLSQGDKSRGQDQVFSRRNIYKATEEEMCLFLENQYIKKPENIFLAENAFENSIIHILNHLKSKF